MNQEVISHFLLQLIFRVFFVFGIFGFAVGVGLIINHVRMQQLFEVMNRWVSMRRSTRWVAIPRAVQPAGGYFRYVIGAVLFFAAAFTVITLIMRINVHMIVTDLDVAAPQSFVAWILESMRWFLVTGGVLAITVGVMLAFFPAAFRAIEMRANHWYSFRNHSRGSDTMHMSLDRWSESHPRMMGWAIAAGSLVMVAAYGIILFVPG